MILYHRTTQKAALSIQKDGFRDGTIRFGPNEVRSGVWLSNEPPSEGEGAHGEVLIEVDTDLTEAEIAKHNWEVIVAPDLHSDREFCVPAALVNSRARLRVLENRRNSEPKWEMKGWTPKRLHAVFRRYNQSYFAGRLREWSVSISDEHPGQFGSPITGNVRFSSAGGHIHLIVQYEQH